MKNNWQSAQLFLKNATTDEVMLQIEKKKLKKVYLSWSNETI